MRWWLIELKVWCLSRSLHVTRQLTKNKHFKDIKEWSHSLPDPVPLWLLANCVWTFAACGKKVEGALWGSPRVFLEHVETEVLSTGVQGPGKAFRPAGGEERGRGNRACQAQWQWIGVTLGNLTNERHGRRTHTLKIASITNNNHSPSASSEYQALWSTFSSIF